MPFFKQHVHYLGHLISEQGIQPVWDKISPITNLTAPKNVDEFLHFLGLSGYYRKFILLFTDITKPPNKLLWKDTKCHWSTKCQAAFNHLKNALCEKPILHYPNINKPHTLFTDASSFAISGISTQAVDGPDDLRSIASTSGSFSDM